MLAILASNGILKKQFDKIFLANASIVVVIGHGQFRLSVLTCTLEKFRHRRGFCELLMSFEDYAVR